MSAAVETGIHTCEFCGDDFTRRPRGESVDRFHARRYCKTGCATKARRRTKAAAPIDIAPHRVVAGVWRPNAPGWPNVPGART